MFLRCKSRLAHGFYTPRTTAHCILQVRPAPLEGSAVGSRICPPHGRQAGVQRLATGPARCSRPLAGSCSRVRALFPCSAPRCPSGAPVSSWPEQAWGLASVDGPSSADDRLMTSATATTSGRQDLPAHQVRLGPVARDTLAAADGLPVPTAGSSSSSSSGGGGGGGSGGDSRERSPDFFANAGQAQRTIRDDFRALFDRDLDYSIYREDIVFRGPTITLHGMGWYKRTWRQLRFASKVLFRESRSEVQRMWNVNDFQFNVRWSIVGELWVGGLGECRHGGWPYIGVFRALVAAAVSCSSRS